MIVANPIYDIVFKYLMEDERIARTILSALLKKDVVAVEVRPHEYTNDKRDAISVFRIGFGATIREADGSEHLILIELQKTWLPTETLRFRQYLGVQYENPRNIVSESPDQHALPMVCVYLLGHKVGDIEEPVLYVCHQSYDYDDNVVTKGLPDPFIDSLTHDSIIVQIPRLHGQINNRLDEVLSIFDQTRKDTNNHQMLRLSNDLYSEEDLEMQRIVRRLLMAATDADMRMDMNVEDEYYSIIEKQDTDILMKDREIARKNVELKEINTKLKETSTQLEQKDAQLKETSTQLEQKDAQLKETSTQLEQKDAQLEQKDAQLEQKDAQLSASIQMLLQSGISPETIADNLGVGIETVNRNKLQ